MIFLIRLVLAAVFIYAGVIKIANPRGFVENIDNYQILPYLLVTIVALILPWVEVITGLALILGRWLQGASTLIILMNVVFIIAIASALLRGLDIDCGCYSTSGVGTPIGIQKIIEDSLLILGAWLIYQSRSEDPHAV